MFLCNKPGRTLVTVYLEDIAEKLEEASDHWEQYLNVATGEFEYLPDGVYVQPDKDLAERIDASGDYLRLPTNMIFTSTASWSLLPILFGTVLRVAVFSGRFVVRSRIDTLKTKSTIWI